MTKIRLSLIAALLLAGALFSGEVSAAQQNMCRPNTSGTSAGPARWVAPASGTAYSLDNAGCTIIALADIGDASAGGFVQSGSFRSVIYNNGVLTGTTDQVIGNVPAGWYIRELIVSNSVAAAITGGIAFGTTANGTDVVTALTCGASCLTFVADSALTKRVFSTTVTTPIHAAAVTAWNSANPTITMIIAPF